MWIDPRNRTEIWLAKPPRWLGLRTPTLRKAATDAARHLIPLAAIGSSLNIGYLRGEDGFGIYLLLEPRQPTPSVVFAFRSGEIWTVDAYSVNAAHGMPLTVPQLAAALDQCAGFLRDKLDIKPPYRCVAGLEGVAGQPVWLPANSRRVFIQNPFGSCITNTICIEANHEEGANARTTLRPFFETVLDRCGWEDFSLLDGL